VDPHGSDIARNQNPASIGGDTQNLRIGSAIGNYAGGVPEIEGWLSSSQTPRHVGIEIRVRLKGDSQAALASLSFLRPLETFYHLRGHRMPGLDFLEEPLLISQVSIYFRRMFQNERDSPVDLGQRTDGWISFEDGFRRPPAPEVVSHNVKTDTRPGDVVAAVMDFDVFTGGHRGHRSISFYNAPGSGELHPPEMSVSVIVIPDNQGNHRWHDSQDSKS